MYDINSNVLSQSGYSASQMNEGLTEGLSGLGQDFVDIENKYGINAVFASAHAAIESAWGTSYLSMTKNNLFGIAAFDTNPNDAYSFASISACFDYYGQFLLHSYLTPGGSWYTGTTIHDVFIHYSTSHDIEAANIANLMNQIAQKIVNVYVPPVGSDTGLGASQYMVKEGDCLSCIAAAHGILDWHTLYAANMSIIGSNPNLIKPGMILNLVAPTGKPTNNVTYQTYRVVRGDSLWKIAQEKLGDGKKYNEIALLNGVAGPQYRIFPGEVLNIPNS